MPFSEHHGVILFLDMAGFTKMTEEVRRGQGLRGVEQLTGRLNQLFAAMVAIIYRSGGDVLKFGGDALLVAFDERDDTAGGALEEAACCVSQLRRAIRSNRQLGRGGLSFHIGLGAGSWIEIVAGVNGERREHFVYGQAVERAMSAAEVSDRESCVLSANHKPRVLPQAIDLHSLAPHLWELHDRRRCPEHSSRETTLPQATPPDWLWDFVPPLIRPYVSEEHFGSMLAAEHRRVCSLFVFWQGYQAREESADLLTWDRFVSVVYRTVREANGMWARSDPAKKYQKLLLLFGTPVNADDDIDRALRCALMLQAQFAEMKREWPHFSTRMGVTTGTAFAGFVGGRERHEFTVMGDSVNLAARLAAKARPGVIRTDQRVRDSTDQFVFANGPVEHLKGFRRPVATFRLLPGHASRPQEDDDVVEYSAAMTRCLHLWEKPDCAPLHLHVSAGVNGSKFVRQLLGRLGIEPARIVRLRGEPHDRMDQGAALRRFLLDIANLSNMDRLRRSDVAQLDQSAWDTLDTLFIGGNRLIGAISRMGIATWCESVVHAVVSSGLLRATNGSQRVIVLENAQHLPEADSGVVKKLVAHPGATWRFLIADQATRSASAAEDGLHVTLGALSKEKLRDFLRQILPHGTPSAQLIDTLHAHSGGIPGIARELLEHLRAEGHVSRPSRETGLWQLRSASIVGLPDGLRGHFIQEIDRLPLRASLVVRALSVLGSIAPLDALESILEHSLETSEIRTALDLAGSASIIDKTANSLGTCYIFHDPICREAVYETLSYQQRERWHHKAADYWRDKGVTGNAEAAEHLFRARDRAALPLLKRAAKQAERLWLLDRARLYLRWALLTSRGKCDPEYAGLLPSIKPPLDTTERALLEPLAGILKLQGDYANAARLYQILSSDAFLRRDVAAELENRLSATRVDWLSGRYERASKQARRVLRLARVTSDGKAEASALFLLGETARRTGRLPRAVEFLEEAVRSFERIGDMTSIYDPWNALGLACWNRGELERARTCFLTALKSCGESRNPDKRGQIANNLGILAEENGQLRTAERFYRRGFVAFDRLGARRNRAYSLGNLANLYRHGARYEQARAAYEEVELELRSIGEQHAAAYTVGNRGDLARDFGDWDGAANLYQRTLDYAQRVNDAELISESFARMAQLLIWKGNLAPVRQLLTRAAEAAQKAESREFVIRVELLNAELDALGESGDDAIDAFRHIAAEACEAGFLYYRLWALFDECQCHLSRNDHRVAAQLARAGVAHARKSGYRMWEFRYATLGALSEAERLSRAGSGSACQCRMLARACSLRAEIERSIGDPFIRSQFASLPLVSALRGLESNGTACLSGSPDQRTLERGERAQPS